VLVQAFLMEMMPSSFPNIMGYLMFLITFLMMSKVQSLPLFMTDLVAKLMMATVTLKTAMIFQW
jgi:hypothetical protein